MTVEEFLTKYCRSNHIEARSAYNGRMLFTSQKGKRYEKWKNSEVVSIWSKIQASNSDGYSQIA